MKDTTRKIGRPKLAADEARNERLPAPRVTAAERQHVELMADRAGVSLAEFCRRAILGQRMPQRRTRDIDRAIVELNRVGVNLNQIAHAVNAGRGLPSDFPEVLAEVQAAVAGLVEGGE